MGVGETLQSVTNAQLYFAIGVPLLFNSVLIGLVVAFISAKFEAGDRRVDGMDHKFEGRFDAVDRRFDDMRDLWRAELRRVEEVLYARLKHLEDRA